MAPPLEHKFFSTICSPSPTEGNKRVILTEVSLFYWKTKLHKFQDIFTSNNKQTDEKLTQLKLIKWAYSNLFNTVLH